MRDIVIDSVCSAKGNINTKNRKFCFELLGYDFLIDEDFRTWLLEVNNNPYLGYQNLHQYEILQKMILNIFNLTVHPFL